MPRRPHRRSGEPLQCGSDMSHRLLSLPLCTSRCSSSPGISWFPRKIVPFSGGWYSGTRSCQWMHSLLLGWHCSPTYWQTELGICALCPENHINFSVYIFKNHVFILTHPVPIQHHRTHPNFALGVFVAPSLMVKSGSLCSIRKYTKNHFRIANIQHCEQTSSLQ